MFYHFIITYNKKLKKLLEGIELNAILNLNLIFICSRVKKSFNTVPYFDIATPTYESAVP
jgi:hypothetical protein